MLALSIIAIVLASVAFVATGLTLIFQFVTQRKLGQLEKERHPYPTEAGRERPFSAVDGSETRTKVS
jgi:hypothetical protein